MRSIEDRLKQQRKNFPSQSQVQAKTEPPAWNHTCWRVRDIIRRDVSKFNDNRGGPQFTFLNSPESLIDVRQQGGTVESAVLLVSEPRKALLRNN